MNRPRFTRVAAGCAATLLALGTGTAANAAVVERDHIRFDIDEVIDGFCGDLTVHGQAVARGSLLLSRHGDGFEYVVANFRSREALTNLANDLTLTLHTAFHNQDVKVEVNGDGTYTIHARGTGVQQVRGPDGSLASLNAAALSIEILVSDAGTPGDLSDDEQIGDLVVTRSVGRDDTAGVDFCDTIHALIG